MAVLTGILLLVDTYGLLYQNLQIKNEVSVEATADPTKSQIFYIDSAEDLDNVRENLYQKDENGDFILDGQTFLFRFATLICLAVHSHLSVMRFLMEVI